MSGARPSTVTNKLTVAFCYSLGVDPTVDTPFAKHCAHAQCTFQKALWTLPQK